MNIFEFILGIIIVSTIAGLYRTHLRHQRRGGGIGDGESAALREQVRALQARVATLERITLEKENSLERQIEELRGL